MAQLLDHRGRPVDMQALREEQAAPSVSSVRQPHRDSVAATLTPKRLARLILAADQGDVDSYLILAEEMEERDLHYRGQLTTRKLAIAGSTVTVEPASDSTEDRDIARRMREDITERADFNDLIFDLADAIGKGYAIAEILWDTTGPRWIPRGYVHRAQRHFRWDDDTLQMLRLQDEKDIANGIPLAPFKFIVHTPKLKSGLPLRGGIARVAATAYMLKSYTLRDWHIFMEVFGMPLRVGKYDSNATPEDKQRLKQAVSEIGVDAAGIIPDSMKIEFIESMKSQGGEKLFQGAADWLDAQVSKGILGQTMTADNGSSESQARVHDEVRGDILDADNRQIRTPINTQLAKPYVDLNFGARENYPRVVVKAEEPEDDEKNAKTVSTLVQAGMPIPQSWAYEKFGIPEPKAGEAVLVPAKMAVPSTEPVEPGEGGGDEGGGGAPTEPAENARAANFMADRIARLERALNRESRTEDTIDEVAEQAVNENWEPMLEGTVGRIIDMARNSGTFEELKAKLDGAVEQFQVSRAQAELAKACFKARGFGDATDDMHR